MKKNLFLLLLAILFGSSSHIINENVTLTHNIINLEDEYIGIGGSLTLFENGIVGIESSNSLPPFFQITSLSNKQYILHQSGDRGQGPDDFNYPSNIQYLDNNSFGVYESGIKSYKEVSISENKNHTIIRNKISFNSSYFKLIKTKNNQYVGLSQNNGLFHLIDSIGTINDVFFEYPYKDNEEFSNNNNQSRAMAYQGLLVTNHQKTKIAYTSLYGDIIHFYNIDNNKISLIKKIENSFPIYTKVEGPGFTAAQLDFKNTVAGYISISASDEFIYALYCDKKVSELINNNSITKTSSTLKIFDWNGILINTYDLDVPCIQICISNDDKILWALAHTPEITPVIFNLK